MTSAREQILRRLRASPSTPTDALPPLVPHSPWQKTERIRQFVAVIESVRGKVHRVASTDWLQCLDALVHEHRIEQLLIGPQVWPGSAIVNRPPNGVRLLSHDDCAPDWQQTLFHDIDTAVTGAIGGIAETGSIIVWPTPEEPRLMSLVPPLHIVVLDAEQLFDTFEEVVRVQRWGNGMPTNALLISGPSKSADIEQVLAYGVHGPKQLVVILCE